VRSQVIYSKSSHSFSHNNCVEVGGRRRKPRARRWRKSTLSHANGDCVEASVAHHPNRSLARSKVLVRDTQDRSGPVLEVPGVIWGAFVNRLNGSTQP
jgi:hypothetical protein